MQVRAASDASSGGISSRRVPLTSRNDTRRPLPKGPPGIAATAAAYAQQTPQRRALSARTTAGSMHSKRQSMGAMDPLAPFGYQTMSPIAQGAFSQVARARHLSTQREVAVKTFNKAKIGKEPHLVQAMKNELDVLRALQPSAHPHVANVVELLDTKNSLHCILEYCSGGSLQRKLAGRPHATGLPEREAGAIAAQVGAALMHMHTHGIAHRDIKPENILFVNATHTEVKLCDFGFAVACGTRRVKTVCGSPQYMAPELSRREPYHAWAVDMWAFGCVIYELLEGKPAFRGSSMEQLNIRIVRASHEAFTSATPHAARALVKDLLTIDVAHRSPARIALQHQWFAAVGQAMNVPPAPPRAPPARAASPARRAAAADGYTAVGAETLAHAPVVAEPPTTLPGMLAAAFGGNPRSQADGEADEPRHDCQQQ